MTDVTEPEAILAEALETLAADDSTVAERGEAAESILLVAERAPATLVERSDEVARIMESTLTTPDTAPTAQRTDTERSNRLIELERDLAAAARAAAESGTSVPGAVDVVVAALGGTDPQSLAAALEGVDALLDVSSADDETSGDPGEATDRTAEDPTTLADEDRQPVIEPGDARKIADRLASLLRSDDSDVMTAAGERMNSLADLFPEVAVEHVGAISDAVDPAVGGTSDGNSVLALQTLADHDHTAVGPHTDAVASFIQLSAGYGGSYAPANVHQGLFVFQKVADQNPAVLVPHVELIIEMLTTFDTFRVHLHGLGALQQVAVEHPRVVSKHAEGIAAVVAGADTAMHAERAVLIASSLAEQDPNAFAPHVETLLHVVGRFDDYEDPARGDEEASVAAVVDDGIANVIAQVAQTNPHALTPHVSALETLLDRAATVHDPHGTTALHIVVNTMAATVSAGEQAPGVLAEVLPTAEQVADAVDHENVTVNLLAAYRTLSDADPGTVVDRTDRVATALARTTHERGRHSGLAALAEVAAVNPAAVAPHVGTMLDAMERTETDDPVLTGLLVVHHVADDSPQALVDVVDRILVAARSVGDPQAVGVVVEAFERVAETQPQALVPLLGDLLKVLDGPDGEDLAVAEQTLSLIRSVGQKRPTAIAQHLTTLDALFERFDDQYIRSNVVMLFGIAATERPDAIVERLPQLLSAVETFTERGPLINGTAGIGEFAKERPESILDHWDRIIGTWPTDEPLGLANLAEVLEAVVTVDEAVVTSELPVVVPGLRADDERVPQAILEAMSGIASISPDAIVTHAEAVVACLERTDTPTVATAALATLAAVAEDRATPLLTHGDAIAHSLDRFDDPEVATTAFTCLVTIADGSVAGWIEDYAGAIIRALHQVEDPHARTAGLIALQRPARTGNEQVIDKGRILSRLIADATEPDLLVVGTGVLYEVARTAPSAVMPYAADIGAAIRETSDPAGTLWDALGPKLPGANGGKAFLIGVLSGFAGIDRDRAGLKSLEADATAAVNHGLAWVLDGTESAAAGGGAMDVLAVTGTTVPSNNVDFGRHSTTSDHRIGLWNRSVDG